MAINYSPKVNRVEFASLLADIFMMSSTLQKGIVTTVDAKGTAVTFSRMNTVPNLTLFTGATPSTSGSSINLADASVLPALLQSYIEYNPFTHRASRIGSDVSSIWDSINDQAKSAIAEDYSRRVMRQASVNFWNGATSATAVSVAALTADTSPFTNNALVNPSEKAYVASITGSNSYFDGIITRMIYQDGALGGRVKVAGTTITASNIYTEYEKLFNAIPAANFEQSSPMVIVAPESHRQLITTYNNAGTYRTDYFEGNSTAGYSLNGIRIVFEPLPEKCMIVGFVNDSFNWLFDSVNDMSFMEMNTVANNSKLEFFWLAYAQNAYVRNAQNNVLYLG